MARIMVATAELPASAIDILEAAGDVDIWRGATPISTEDLVTQVAGADALVTLVDTVVDARVLRSAPRLRAGLGNEVRTIMWATGYRPDFHWLDVPVFASKRQRSITVGCVDG